VYFIFLPEDNNSTLKYVITGIILTGLPKHRSTVVANRNGVTIKAKSDEAISGIKAQKQKN